MNDEWIDFNKERPNDEFSVYLVKKENGEEEKAFFMPDKIAWVAFFGIKTSFWMGKHSGQLIHDVTHWKR